MVGGAGVGGVRGVGFGVEVGAWAAYGGGEARDDIGAIVGSVGY